MDILLILLLGFLQGVFGFLPMSLEGIQAVICGHTHSYREEWIDGRLWLNPGSCGRARFYGGVTMAKMLLRDGKILDVRRIDLPG